MLTFTDVLRSFETKMFIQKSVFRPLEYDETIFQMERRIKHMTWYCIGYTWYNGMRHFCGVYQMNHHTDKM